MVRPDNSIFKGMKIGELVAVKYKPTKFEYQVVSEAVLIDRTVTEAGLERWHALIDGKVIILEPWQIGPVKLAQVYREKKLKASRYNE